LKGTPWKHLRVDGTSTDRFWALCTSRADKVPHIRLFEERFTPGRKNKSRRSIRIEVHHLQQRHLVELMHFTRQIEPLIAELQLEGRHA
jgi:hypothetical protein